MQYDDAMQAMAKKVPDTCLLLTGLELALLILNQLNMSQLTGGGSRDGEEGQCLVPRTNWSSRDSY